MELCVLVRKNYDDDDEDFPVLSESPTVALAVVPVSHRVVHSQGVTVLGNKTQTTHKASDLFALIRVYGIA